ncbi:MAG: sialidase family protein [Chloroflexota bacterium]
MKLSYKLWTLVSACAVGLLVGLSQNSAKADSAAIQQDGWTLPASSVSNAGQRASVPTIALQADGTLHSAFKQGSTVDLQDNDPYHTSSTDNGNTWSIPQAIRIDPATFVVDKVVIEVGTSGVLHAAWVERDPVDERYDLLYSSNSGSGWSPAQTVESVENQFVIDQPSMVLEGGQVHMVWASTGTIRYSKRSSGTWSIPIEIEDSSSELPEIAIDSAGTLHVVFLQSRDTLVARYSQSTDGGVTWTPDISLSGSGRDLNDVDLDVSGTEVHVVYSAADVIGSVIDPIASTQTVRPYHRRCIGSCTSVSSWTVESLVSNFDAGNVPADAILLVPTVSVTDNGEALVFFHGVLAENTNFEQVLGNCFEPDTSFGKSFKLPTSFTERMIKPQIIYNDGVMHMVYEQIRGQAASATFQQIHYAQLEVSCYDMYLPLINRS